MTKRTAANIQLLTDAVEPSNAARPGDEFLRTP